MRLFAGIYPPLSMVEDLAKLAGRLKQIYPTAAFVKPDRMHVTLRFFGDAEAADAARSIETAIADTAAFDLELDHIDSFPNRESARVLHCGLKEPEFVERMISAMARPDDREPHAHMTLARFRPKQSVELAAIEPLVFRAAKVTLVNSVLGANSRYEVVREWTLR
ncbi:MAG: RNA 2',3'-cyclic phosphodiesterase [Armatimonadota bacterium]|nr:RNA 2',3'-cyclic phosphodiesterase [Armatimonadota bacterium]